MNRNVISIALTVFVLLVLIKIFNIGYPVELKVVNSNVQSEMAVTGTGKVEVIPDVAYIDAGITISRAKSAEEAKTRMTTVNNKIIEAVKALGIEKEDITTSNFSINPEYDYSGNPIPLDAVTEPDTGSGVAGSSGAQAIPEKMIAPIAPDSRSRIVGYNGNATIAVKVRDSSKTAQVIQKVTEAGANNVGSPRFAVDSPEKYQEQARSKAIQNAKEQAQKLAKELGIRLGGITNMVEGGGGYPIYDARTMNYGVAEAKASVPPTIEEGQQTVTSTVTLYFERK